MKRDPNFNLIDRPETVYTYGGLERIRKKW